MTKIISIFIFLFFTEIFSQTDSIPKSENFDFIPDSTRIFNPDTLKVNKSKSGLDTIIEMKSNDTITFNLKKKTMRLKTEASIDMGGRILEADEIIIRFEENTLEALSGKDSSGNSFGFPKLTEKGEDYFGERILYNYKTAKGVISQGETELDEGYYYGKRIKKITQNEFNIQDGFYTPCEEENPSAYFGSSEMKMIGKSKIFLDPIIFYVQDMPILAYPFGLYFSMQSGRKSGFIVPQFDISGTRGLVFQEFGYYWAASEYWDAKFTADFYSKGGFVAKSLFRFKQNEDLNGSIDLQWGKVRFNPDDPLSENYSVKVNNFNWVITPQDRINGNFNFSTQDFNRRTSSQLNQRISQNIVSNISYSRNFDNGSNISVNYNRNQQIITDEYTQTPRIEFTLPNKSMFKLFDKDVNFSYSGRFEGNYNKDLKITSFDDGNGLSYDSTFQFNSKNYLYHNPRVNLNLPKIWQFNVQPNINLGMNNFFRRMNRFYDSNSDSLIETFEQGFFTEYWWSTGFRVQTRLYGISQAEFLRKINLKGIRHTMEPSFSYNYRPDQSNTNFFSSYINSTGTETIYRVFEKDGGGGSASNRTSQNISYNLNNKFEVKIDKGDSLEALNLEVLNFNLNGSYDFERDSLKFSDISANFNTPVLDFLNFSGNMSLSLYDNEPIYNTNNEITSAKKVDRTLLEAGKGLVRVESFSIGLGTSFSDEGISLNQNIPEQEKAIQDSSFKRLGSRLFSNTTADPNEFDIFGDNSPGYAPLNFKWNVRINVNYLNNRRNPYKIDETLSSQVIIDMNLTSTLKLSGGLNYDFINKRLSAPQIQVYKDLGCWDMSLNWTPIGIHRSLFFRIGLKASQLKDFQYLLRESNIY